LSVESPGHVRLGQAADDTLKQWTAAHQMAFQRRRVRKLDVVYTCTYSKLHHDSTSTREYRRESGQPLVVKQRIAPGRRNDMPPPPNRRRFDPKVAADLRPSADGSAVRTSLVAGGGSPAGSRRVHINPRQLRRGQTDGRIALFQNAP